MPLDPQTGLWQTPGLNENPGPGGPGSALGGLLGVMNAFRSRSLTDQADALRQQAEMEAITKNAQAGGAMFETPEGQAGAGAFGISPETTTAIYEESPNRRLRMALGELTKKYPGAQIPSWEIENAYITQGMAPPTGLYGYMGREKTAETGNRRITSQMVEKMAATMAQAAARSASAGEDESTQRQKAEDAAGPVFALLAPEDQDKVLAQFEAARAAATKGKAAPLPTARVGELQARAGAETARANYLNKIAGPTAEALADKHGLSDLRAELLRVKLQIERAKVGGTLTPSQRAHVITQIAALEAKRADRMNAPAFGIGASDEVVAAEKRRVLKEYAGAITELRGMLEASPGAAAPTGGKSYTSPEQVRDDPGLSPEQKTSILKSQFGFGD